MVAASTLNHHCFATMGHHKAKIDYGTINDTMYVGVNLSHEFPAEKFHQFGYQTRGMQTFVFLGKMESPKALWAPQCWARLNHEPARPARNFAAS